MPPLDPAETIRDMGRQPRETLTPILRRVVAAQEWLDVIASLPFSEPHLIPEDARPIGKVHDELSPTGASFTYESGDLNEDGDKRYYKVPTEP